MAYSVTGNTENDYKRVTVSGRRHLIYNIIETDAAVGSEFEIQGILFHMMTLVKYQSTVISGTGTTINPTLGKVTGWPVLAQNDIGTNAETLAHINDESHCYIQLDTNSIFVRSNINAGTDTVIHTHIVLAEGLI